MARTPCPQCRGPGVRPLVEELDPTCLFTTATSYLSQCLSRVCTWKEPSRYVQPVLHGWEASCSPFKQSESPVTTSRALYNDPRIPLRRDPSGLLPSAGPPTLDTRFSPYLTGLPHKASVHNPAHGQKHHHGWREILPPWVWCVVLCSPQKQIYSGFPSGSVVKNPSANARDTGSIPGPGDPTCCGATKPILHNYGACALEPTGCSYWACAP